MSKREKFIKKLQTDGANFTYRELRTLLTGMGYIEHTKGKSSGSRVAFMNEATNHIIRLHKPHPGNQLKRYQINLIRDELKKEGLL